MKKVLLLLFLVISSIGLIACNKRDSKFDQVFKDNLIEFADGDTEKHVTKNVTLKQSSSKVKDAKITWESDNPEVIRIEDSKGVVTRTSEDKVVKLTATVKIDKKTKNKEFSLTVKAKSSTDNPVPSKAIAIKGTKNWDLYVGSNEPDFMAGVTAVDMAGQSVDVSIIENTVDMNKIGHYVVVYEATSGDIRTTKTVIVKVKPIPVASEFVTETFDNVPDSGSTYEDLSFTGINGIYWTVLGSRSDEPFDGRAITFGGGPESKDKSTIRASISGGIQKFTVDLKVAFSGTTKDRSVELFINGESYGKFTLDNHSSEAQTFTVDHINIDGTFNLELKHVGKGTGREQISIDNLSWVPFYGGSSEEGSLDQELTDLDIPMEYTEDGTIDLPTTTDNGNAVTWNYLEQNDENNQYINLTNKTVTLPESGRKIVKLVATITSGEETGQKVFTVIVGEAEISPIIVVRHESNGAHVLTEGIVTDFYETDEYVKFFFEDETGGILVIAPISYRDDIKTGNRIRIEGSKNFLSNQQVINNITNLTVIKSDETVTAKTIETKDELTNYIGQFVEINGLLRQVHPSYTDDFWIVNEHGEFNLVMPDDLSDEAKTAIRDLLAGKSAGLEVTVLGVVIGDGESKHLSLLDVENIELESTINIERVKTIILSNFDEPDFPEEVTNNLILPISDDLLFDAVIEWTSSHPSIISTDGSVYLPEDEGKTVRLTYTITLDGTKIVEKDFDVFVPKRPDFSDYYRSAEGKTGTALMEELRRIISNMKDRGYDKAKTVLPESDADLNNPGYMIFVYDRDTYKATWDGSWNREHVWPQSLLNGASKSDLHNLKPSNIDVNSSRGSLRFVDGSGSYGKTNGGWYPGDDDRGDIARILFYMVTRYSQLSLSTMGDLNTLLKWHREDPVDDFERNRNEVIYSYQENRNPFIDHPEFVEMIFGTSTTKLASDFATNTEIYVDLQVFETRYPFEERHRVA